MTIVLPSIRIREIAEAPRLLEKLRRELVGTDPTTWIAALLDYLDQQAAPHPTDQKVAIRGFTDPPHPDGTVMHKLWGIAHDNPGYDKEDWKTLQREFRATDAGKLALANKRIESLQNELHLSETEHLKTKASLKSVIKLTVLEGAILTTARARGLRADLDNQVKLDELCQQLAKEDGRTWVPFCSTKKRSSDH